MDCKEFMLRMWVLLDDEPDAPTCETLRAHLDMCPPCQQHYRFETVLRIHVRRCCSEPAPELLRRRVRRILADLGDA